MDLAAIHPNMTFSGALMTPSSHDMLLSEGDISSPSAQASSLAFVVTSASTPMASHTPALTNFAYEDPTLLATPIFVTSPDLSWQRLPLQQPRSQHYQDQEHMTIARQQQPRQHVNSLSSSSAPATCSMSTSSSSVSFAHASTPPPFDTNASPAMSMAYDRHTFQSRHQPMPPPLHEQQPQQHQQMSTRSTSWPPSRAPSVDTAMLGGTSQPPTTHFMDLTPAQPTSYNRSPSSLMRPNRPSQLNFAVGRSGVGAQRPSSSAVSSPRKMSLQPQQQFQLSSGSSRPKNPTPGLIGDAFLPQSAPCTCQEAGECQSCTAAQMRTSYFDGIIADPDHAIASTSTGATDYAYAVNPAAVYSQVDSAAAQCVSNETLSMVANMTVKSESLPPQNMGRTWSARGPDDPSANAMEPEQRRRSVTPSYTGRNNTAANDVLITRSRSLPRQGNFVPMPAVTSDAIFDDDTVAVGSPSLLPTPTMSPGGTTLISESPLQQTFDHMTSALVDEDDSVALQRLEKLQNAKCCSRGCLSRLTEDMVLPFLKDVLRMDKRSRELYILILLQQCREHGPQVSRKKQTRQRQRDKYNYNISPVGFICHDAFIQLFGVTKGYLDALQSYLRQQNSVIPRVHGNWKSGDDRTWASNKNRKRRALVVEPGIMSAALRDHMSTSPTPTARSATEETPPHHVLQQHLHDDPHLMVAAVPSSVLDDGFLPSMLS